MPYGDIILQEENTTASRNIASHLRGQIKAEKSCSTRKENTLFSSSCVRRLTSCGSVGSLRQPMSDCSCCNSAPEVREMEGGGGGKRKEEGGRRREEGGGRKEEGGGRREEGGGRRDGR